MKNSQPPSTLLTALRQLCREGFSRFCMPGHKGLLPEPLTTAAAFDLTELPETDNLLDPTGPLAVLERRFSALYQSESTALSAGGSTLSIQAMLALLPEGGKVICQRGVHSAVLGAMALLDLQPVWVYSQSAGMGGIPTPPPVSAYERALSEHPDAKGVVLCSLDYYGQMPEIGAIAECCHKRGVPLLCDNAHGAHLPFLAGPLHPLAQGADAVADSLHKMLPALTGSALLHTGKGNLLPRKDIKSRMRLFASTSPSFLIALSCDMLCGMLEEGLGQAVEAAAARLDHIKETASAAGVGILSGGDRLRLCLPLWGVCSQAEADSLCRECEILPELCSPLALVLLCSPNTKQEDWQRLERLLKHFPKGAGSPALAPPTLPPRDWQLRLPVRCSLRAAYLGQGREIALSEALDCVAALPVCPCPPAVPLVVGGEVFTERAILLCKNYGITRVNVL